MKKNSNNLISEKSPYLLQHAFNPVNWYPWGEEAFRKALAEDKPIFLSIGYSTCHWCHVMEEESFEDIEVAKLMNDVFVCIKVDREERPDIDKIYMEFCQMLTGSGGWPLTIIMTPDKKPFFAGTYIPKQNKYGRIGMLALVPQIKELWLNERSNVLKSSEEIVRHFSKQFVFSSQGIGLDKTILDLTFENLIKLFDKTNGGFGKSPKFPTIHHLYFLLRYWKKTKNKKALEMVEKTLEAMRFGGIWDQIGFGFHRYSTDEKWIVPHFEKMLYDQALISIAYIEAYQATSCEKYKKTVEEIFTYILRDMTSKEGGFYSAEDADSEGVEGKFYCWTKDEIKKIFPVKESVMIIDIFNIGRSNLETGSVLYVTESAEDIAAKYNLTLEDLNEFLHSSTNKMFNERKKRIHPFKDDKILTDWNGMMISALALGARVFDKKVYEEAAVRAADFIINNLITKEGFLLHRYRDGQSAITANLDDYSFFIMGLLELYETTFNKSYLKIALELNKVLLDNFWDYDNGGFYFTPGDSEMKNFRLKDIYDGAIPSGNSISILNLTKLGRITATLDFEDKALQIVKTFSKPVNEAPEAHTQFISSLDFIIGPAHEIVIVGYPDAKETRKIFGAMNNVFAPNKIVILKIPGIPDITTTEFPGFVKDLKMINNESTIYVCSDYNCKLPTNNIDEMLQLLN